MREATRTAMKGSSLLEILVASALLGGILVSTLTLSLMAGRSMAEARRQTRAHALAGDVMETLRGLHPRHCWELLDPRSGGGRHEACWQSESPPAPKGESQFLDTWRQRAESLPGGRLQVRVRGLSGFGQPAPTRALQRAAVLHVMLRLTWREGQRERSLVLQTFRS